jgi:hypothetical protein
VAIPFHLEAVSNFLILNAKCNCVTNLHLVSWYVWSAWECNSGRYLLQRTSNTKHENCLSAHESCHTDIQSGRGIVPHCLNLESYTWVINLLLCFTLEQDHPVTIYSSKLIHVVQPHYTWIIGNMERQAGCQSITVKHADIINVY